MNAFVVRRGSIRLVAFGLCFLFCLLTSYAQVPEEINYQGRVIENGLPVNATTTLVFKIYNQSTGGGPLYEETQTVAVIDGLYSTAIGASNAAPGALTALLTNQTVYLEVMVGTATLSPRERVTSVAYSLMTDGVKAGGVTEGMLSDGAVTSAKIADGTISSVDLGSDSVTGGAIADGSITSSDLADASVGAGQLASKYQSGSLIYTNTSYFPTSPSSVTVEFSYPFSKTPIVTANLSSEFPERLAGQDRDVSITTVTVSNFTAQLTGLGAGEVVGPLNVVQSGTVDGHVTLEAVNGRPAIVYSTTPSNALQYVRADNSTGLNWGSPIPVGGSKFVSLAVIDGRPAISYYLDDFVNFLYYARAADADGSAWPISNFILVDGPGSFGRYNSLAQVNGRPAISGYDSGADNLVYVRANDAAGSTWGTLVPVDTAGDTGQHTSLAVVNGRPAISYYDVSATDLNYVRANDADGTTWPTPMTVDPTMDVGTYSSLAVVNGRPAISYYDVSATDLFYVTAADADGTSWGAPIPVDTDGDVGEFTSLAVINGRPAISYYDIARGDLRFVLANDVNGSSWGTPFVLDEIDDVGAYSSLAEVDGAPAIAYYADLPHLNAKYVRGASLEPQPATVIEVVDAGVDAGEYASLVPVNGRPAISYFADTTNLKYVRAADEKGAAWGAPVAVEINARSGVSASLAIINGRPAIGYSELINIVNSDLKFARAADANGTSWGSAVTVDDVSNVRAEVSLAEVNGRPAMAYGDFTPDFDLMYVRALDADGTTWDTPLAIDTNNQIGMEVSLAVVNARPAICYRDDTEQAMKYVRASDTDGASWGGPIAVTGTGGNHYTLGIVNGHPAISYSDFGARAVKYVRATDVDGSGWNPAVTLETNADGFRYTSLTVIGGLPTISYYDVTLSGLKYVQATDADGTSWETPIAVEIDGDVGPYNTVLDLNGRPGISYHHETNGELKFFTEIEKPISINWIAVEP